MAPKEPRDGSVSIAGIPWMARMIDKARLEAAGEIEQFDLDYPCPMDRRLLNQLGIDGKTFQQIAVENQDDAVIVEKLKAQGVAI
jgi:hypothetical protein